LDRFISKNELIEPIRTEERQRELNVLHDKKIKNARPARAYNTSFLLSGLLYCAECGEKMMTSTTQPKNSDKKHSYYRCKSQGTNYYKTKCENHGYRKEEIETYVLQVVKEKIGDFLDLEVHKIVQEKIKLEKKTYVNQADVLKDKIIDFEKKLNRYTELVEEHDSSEEDIDLQKIYMKKQRDILKELNDLRKVYVSLGGEVYKNLMTILTSKTLSI